MKNNINNEDTMSIPNITHAAISIIRSKQSKNTALLQALYIIHAKLRLMPKTPGVKSILAANDKEMRRVEAKAKELTATAKELESQV